MAVLRFDLWKHSDVYGLDLYWSNRWYLDLPRTVQDTFDDMKALINIEAAMHLTHVRYSHVTVVNPLDPQDASMWAASNDDPYSPEFRGDVGYTSEPMPYEYVKRVRKFPLMGRSGFWWFRGGLESSEIDTTSRYAHQGIIDAGNWRNRLENWLDLLAARDAVLMIGLGSNQAGAPTSFIPVQKLVFDGLIIAKASKRARSKAFGRGPAIADLIPPALVEFRNWWSTIYSLYITNSDRIPQSYKQDTVTELGILRAILAELKSYADDVAAHQNDATHPTAFRWSPFADSVATFAESTLGALDNALDSINEIEPYTDDGSHFYITHDQTGTLQDIIITFVSVYSQISLYDYRNPANSRLG